MTQPGWAGRLLAPILRQGGGQQVQPQPYGAINVIGGSVAVNSATGDVDLTIPTGVGVVPNSVLGLRSIVATASRQFQNVDVYSTAGDGGGGQFNWNATDTRSDDGGTIIAVTGVATGRWNRVYSGALDVRWYGMSAAGSAAANTTAFNAILAAAASLTAASGLVVTILIPKGTFALSPNAIAISTNAIRINGDGTLSTTLAFSAAGTGLAFSGTPVNGYVADLNITVPTGSSSKGIDFTHASYWTFEHVDVSIVGGAQGDCLYATYAGATPGPYYNRFVKGNLTGGNCGVHLAANLSFSGNGPNANHWVGGRISSTNFAVQIESGIGNTFLAPVCETTLTDVFDFGTEIGGAGSCEGNRVFGGYIEGTTAYFVRFHANATGNQIEPSFITSLAAGIAMLALFDPATVFGFNNSDNNCVRYSGIQSDDIVLYSCTGQPARVRHTNNTARFYTLPPTSGQLSCQGGDIPNDTSTTVAGVSATLNKLLHQLRQGLVIVTVPGDLGVVSGSSTLVLDMDARTGVTSASGLVSAWADNSGAGIFSSFTASGGAKPAYVAAEAIFGALPSIQFDGVAQYLDGGHHNLFGGASACTIAAVFSTYESNLGKPIIAQADTAADYFLGLDYNSASGKGGFFAAGDHQGTTNSILTQAVAHRLLGVYDGTHCNVYLDGVLQTTQGSATGAIPYDADHVGIGALLDGSGNPSDFHHMHVTRIIAWSSALSASDLSDLDNLFKTTYGF